MHQDKIDILPSQQCAEKQILRYSEYVSRSELYSHLPKSKQQQYQDEQNKHLFRCNIVKVRIPSSKNGREHKITLQKNNSITKSQIYSRENFQLMKQKLKQKKMNGFNPILEEIGNNQQPRAKTTSHTRRMFHNSDPEQAIPQIKGISSNIEIMNKKTEKRAQSTSNLHNIRKKIEEKQKLQKQKQLYVRTQSKINILKKLQRPFESQPIIYPFKTKIKKKCVEDNLNVMAWIIRKKVKVLDKDQMYDYISNLITKTHKGID